MLKCIAANDLLFGLCRSSTHGRHSVTISAKPYLFCPLEGQSKSGERHQGRGHSKYNQKQKPFACAQDSSQAKGSKDFNVSNQTLDLIVAETPHMPASWRFAYRGSAPFNRLGDPVIGLAFERSREIGGRRLQILASRTVAMSLVAMTCGAILGVGRISRSGRARTSQRIGSTAEAKSVMLEEYCRKVFVVVISYLLCLLVSVRSI